YLMQRSGSEGVRPVRCPLALLSVQQGHRRIPCGTESRCGLRNCLLGDCPQSMEQPLRYGNEGTKPVAGGAAKREPWPIQGGENERRVQFNRRRRRVVR